MEGLEALDSITPFHTRLKFWKSLNIGQEKTPPGFVHI